MWQRRTALLISFLAFAIPAAARPLRGGSTETLTMSLRQLPPNAEEWEAFLSLDGGAHYTIRITPHLDLAVRRVRWVVPNVDAGTARIKIHVGDEHRETSFELPEIFAIARDPSAALPPMRAAPLTRAEEGVAVWAEGDREGTRIAPASNGPAPSGMQSLRAGEAIDDALFDAPRKAISASTAMPGNPATKKTSNPKTQPSHDSNDTLLLSTRMNV